MTEEQIARWVIIIFAAGAALWALWSWLDRKIDAIENRLSGHGERIASLEARRCACEEEKQ